MFRQYQDVPSPVPFNFYYQRVEPDLSDLLQVQYGLTMDKSLYIIRSNNDNLFSNDN